MANILITIGIVLLIMGVVIKFFPDLRFPLLPGDIYINKDNFSFYFPIVTSIIISVILTIIINLFR